MSILRALVLVLFHQWPLLIQFTRLVHSLDLRQVVAHLLPQ